MLDFILSARCSQIHQADATRENRWLATLMAEFGNDSKDVFLDLEMIHREILWQVALIEDSKAVIKKEDGNVSISSRVTIDLDEHTSDIELMICYALCESYFESA